MAKDKVSEGAVIKEPGSVEKDKTGGWRALKPVRDAKKCTKCMLCWQFCPDCAIKKNLDFDYDHCKGCGICAEICPVKAIRMEKEKK